jgi:hypothetical protein
MYSRGWVDPVAVPLLLIKCGTAANWTVSTRPQRQSVPSRNWVDPVAVPLLLRKCGTATNWTVSTRPQRRSVPSRNFVMNRKPIVTDQIVHKPCHSYEHNRFCKTIYVVSSKHIKACSKIGLLINKKPIPPTRNFCEKHYSPKWKSPS